MRPSKYTQRRDEGWADYELRLTRAAQTDSAARDALAKAYAAATPGSILFFRFADCAQLPSTILH